MIKEIRITLYEIVGYLVPGMVALLAIDLLLIGTFRTSFLTFSSEIPYLPAIGLLFVAYLGGHLVQAVGNLLEKRPRVQAAREQESRLPGEVEELVRDAAAFYFGEAVSGLDANDLYELCDQALIHHGSLGEREIFTYREGFYRGLAVALALLSIAVAVCLVTAPLKVVIFGQNVELFRRHLLVGGGLTAIGSWLAYRRYVRFTGYRVRTCLLRFSSLCRAIAGHLSAASQAPEATEE